MIATLLLAVALAAAPQAGPAPAPGSITGVVQEAGSQAPIADARVTLVGPGTRETAIADHAGRFTFMSLPPGTYRLAADRETFAFDPVVMPPVRVESRATATAIVAMQRAGVIVGDVRDERGNPRGGVPITVLRKVSGGTANPPDARHTTNDMGEFRVDGLLAGDYIVLASPPSARVSTVALMPTYYPASTDKDAATTVKVNAGETSANVFITMVSAPAYAISGIVVDEQQRPLARAIVAFVFHAIQTDAPGGQGSMQARVQILATRPDGTFRITGLGPGTYRLTPAPPPPSFPPPNQIEIMTAAIMGTPSTVNVVVRNADVSGVTVVLRPPSP